MQGERVTVAVLVLKYEHYCLMMQDSKDVQTYKIHNENKGIMLNDNLMWPCRHDNPREESRIKRQPEPCYACFWVSSLAEPFTFAFPSSLTLLFLTTSGMEKILGQSSSYSFCRPSKQCRSQIPHTICMYDPMPVMRCLVILNQREIHGYEVKVSTFEGLTTNHAPPTAFPTVDRFLVSIFATSSTGCCLVPRCQNLEGR